MSLMLTLYFLFILSICCPSFAVIPCLFYFSILVHFVYSHVAIVWILRMPVSIVIASFGVDCGTWRIHFMMLFIIVCIFWLSLCVVVLLSASYVIVGMMHVSTSFHIFVIFSPLKFLSFATWSIV